MIYIVDDDEAVRDSLSLLFSAEGFENRSFASAQAFLDELPEATEGTCVITDMHMPGLGGMQLLRGLRASGSDLPVVVITGKSDGALANRALAAGATAFIEKPFPVDELISAVRNALAARGRA